MLHDELGEKIEQIARDMEHAVGGGMAWIDHNEVADFTRRLRALNNFSMEKIDDQ